MTLAFFLLQALIIVLISFAFLAVFLWLGARLVRIPGVGFRRALVGAIWVNVINLASGGLLLALLRAGSGIPDLVLDLSAFLPFALVCVLLKWRWRTTVWRVLCALLIMFVGNGLCAFGLALAYRATIAEAFVIPTGAMAPTVLGRHKDVVCPKCDFPYQVSASGEVDPEIGGFRGEASAVVRGTCPMCRFTANIGRENPQHQQYPSRAGDRILVSKFAYRFGEPGRWDLMVFKYPENTKVNFIQRVVGLPGETVRISHGDIFVKGPQQADFGIARKSPDTLLAALQPVYDNDYVLPSLIQQGWPARWRPVTAKVLAAVGD